MRKNMMIVQENIAKKVFGLLDFAKKSAMRKEDGIDGILVTVGLCIIALLLCVVMKDSLTTFITTLVANMTNKAQTILAGMIL